MLHPKHVVEGLHTPLVPATGVVDSDAVDDAVSLSVDSFVFFTCEKVTFDTLSLTFFETMDIEAYLDKISLA